MLSALLVFILSQIWSTISSPTLEVPEWIVFDEGVDCADICYNGVMSEETIKQCLSESSEKCYGSGTISIEGVEDTRICSSSNGMAIKAAFINSFLDLLPPLDGVESLGEATGDGLILSFQTPIETSCGFTMSESFDPSMNNETIDCGFSSVSVSLPIEKAAVQETRIFIPVSFLDVITSPWITIASGNLTVQSICGTSLTAVTWNIQTPVNWFGTPAPAIDFAVSQNRNLHIILFIVGSLFLC
eukprot:Gregarina_sp_Poly_1__10601@NODE_790_length_6283_cov_36_487934_g578_i0_p2_GENE_NODE_790_length_6283_cov_36_487934_g578_i0NODE_790_length_6283_cov_36_487934_g578_i0_p2_ORF_typecomplete_len244_score37_55_NODE_790_length_6283_cov_36_487934_g578_i02891020